MRQVLAIAVLLLLFSFTINSSSYENEGVAQVRKVNGFDIYMYAEPMADYEELFNVSGFWNWGEMADDRATLDNIVNTMIRNAKKKNKKAYQSGDPKADAIIIYNNDRAIGIRYLSN